MPYEFACADAGCTCNAAWSESSPDAVVQKVAAHLQEKHNVKTISGTLANYVTAAIRKTCPLNRAAGGRGPRRRRPARG